MKKVFLVLAVCSMAGFVSATAFGQDSAPTGPEHQMLKQLEGTWEATANAGGMESKGTAVYKMDLGGLWSVMDYQGEFGGQKYQGRGMDTYDPAKKKFVGVWVHSLSAYPMVTEGTWDDAKKTMTMTGDGP